MGCTVNFRLPIIYIPFCYVKMRHTIHTHSLFLTHTHAHTLHYQVPGLAVAVLTFQVSSEEVCSVPLPASSHLHRHHHHTTPHHITSARLSLTLFRSFVRALNAAELKRCCKEKFQNVNTLHISLRQNSSKSSLFFFKPSDHTHFQFSPQKKLTMSLFQ